MQKSYVALKKVTLSLAAFYILPGDILNFDPANNNNLSIYRDQKLVKTTTFSELGMSTMVAAGNFKEIVSDTNQTPVVETPVTLTPVQTAEESVLVAAVKTDDVITAAVSEVGTVAGEVAAKAEDIAAAAADKAKEVSSDVTTDVAAGIKAVEAEAEQVITESKGDESKAQQVITDATSDEAKVTEVSAEADAKVQNAEDTATGVVKAVEAVEAAGKKTLSKVKAKAEKVMNEAKTVVENATTEVKESVANVVDAVESVIEAPAKIADEFAADVAKITELL